MKKLLLTALLSISVAQAAPMCFTESGASLEDGQYIVSVADKGDHQAVKTILNSRFDVLSEIGSFKALVLEVKPAINETRKEMIGNTMDMLDALDELGLLEYIECNHLVSLF
jgi:hypothetical protein